MLHPTSVKKPYRIYKALIILLSNEFLHFQKDLVSIARMAGLDNFTMLTVLVISTLTLTSMVSGRGMMAREEVEIRSSLSRNLMDENINFAEQVLEVKSVVQLIFLVHRMLILLPDYERKGPR